MPATTSPSANISESLDPHRAGSAQVLRGAAVTLVAVTVVEVTVVEVPVAEVTLAEVPMAEATAAEATAAEKPRASIATAIRPA